MSQSITNISLVAAVSAGLLSFVSSCMLPLIPSYISYITGLSIEQLTDSTVRSKFKTTIVINALKNNTSWWHPMHLHGFSFRVLTRNGIPVRRTWHDTLLKEPNETAYIALVTDNPGDWMLHCHVTDHQESGIMAVIRIS
jgi:multicopper oxidase/cytochrome c biogenesis DsbD-like protein